MVDLPLCRSFVIDSDSRLHLLIFFSSSSICWCLSFSIDVLASNIESAHRSKQLLNKILLAQPRYSQRSVSLYLVMYLYLISLTPLGVQFTMLSSLSASSRSIAQNMSLNPISLVQLRRPLRPISAPTSMCQLKLTHSLISGFNTLTCDYRILCRSEPILLAHFLLMADRNIRPPPCRLGECRRGSNNV